MLRIICPHEHSLCQPLIAFFISMVRCFHPLCLTKELRGITTFIIGEANAHDAKFLHEGDVYGGALLCKRSVKELPPAFQHLILGKAYVWGGVISLFINPKEASSEENELDGCQLFYRELLEKLCEFGNNSNIDLLYLTLSPSEYHYTKQKGLWTYVAEVSPENSTDGLFHGILPLELMEPKTKLKGPSLYQNPLSPSVPKAA